MDNKSRAPLEDKTKTSKDADAKEGRRERDRIRWQQQKDAINKSRREAYHQRINQHVNARLRSATELLLQGFFVDIHTSMHMLTVKNNKEMEETNALLKKLLSLNGNASSLT